MSNIRVFKKGEQIQKEGDKASTVYLIQSGSVLLHVLRQKQSIELSTLGGNQILGEHALSGVATHPYSATALVETKTIEMQVDAVRAQMEQSSPLMKTLFKSFSDKLKVVMTDLRSARMEKDNTPCPPDQTAKIFGTVFHVAKIKGETKKEGVLTVNWHLMKQHAQRVFLESPRRLEMAVNIFVKLGAAKYEMVKNPDDPELPDEIGFVHFSDLNLVEQFFEFYQYYYFKGGKQELLKTDERVMNMVQTLLDVAKGEPLDRHGAVRLDYSKTVEKYKELTGHQLSSDHFANMENKGLFVKRQSTDTGVFLQFELKEFERTLKVWRVLREVERWNEKGSVDPNEPLIDPRKALKTGPCCPSCQSVYEGSPKFCGECGYKLSAAA